MTPSGESFPPERRLRNGSEFRRAYERGRRETNRYFVAFVVERRDGPLRLGVVASRKVGGAVQRNRAKRLLREAFRRSRGPWNRSADVVLVARRGMVGAPFREIERAYARCSRKLLEENR